MKFHQLYSDLTSRHYQVMTSDRPDIVEDNYTAFRNFLREINYSFVGSGLGVYEIEGDLDGKSSGRLIYIHRDDKDLIKKYEIHYEQFTKVRKLKKICEDYLKHLNPLNANESKLTKDTISKITSIKDLLTTLEIRTDSSRTQLAKFEDKLQDNFTQLIKRRDSFLTTFLTKIYQLLGYKGEDLIKKVDNKDMSLMKYKMFRTHGRKVVEEMADVIFPSP